MRDLDTDLAICEAATPGPWLEGATDAIRVSEGWVCQFYEGDDLNGTARHFLNYESNLAFVLAAREGWPEAIRRAQAAEDEVDRLEAKLDRLQDELRMLQDTINQRYQP
ncbi:hypothetical protein [Gorillibacterium sp. sgz500922]|uniref:hypothetical protein n=1 Tax=Gorillibacterium sp. sgz500922 TaxID=3446694 RepID=UPI003F668999